MFDTPTITNLTYEGRTLANNSLPPRKLLTTSTKSTRPEILRRLNRDGYLLLRAALPRNEVLAAGHEIYRRLSKNGELHPNYPPEDGIPAPGITRSFAPETGRHNQPLEQVVFGESMLAVFRRIFGAPIRHFDHIWVRAKSPGFKTVTPPHYDIVYMGRGTHKLLTAWTPLCDMPLEMGGLMLLENSHHLTEVRGTYGQIDVDTYCANRPEEAGVRSGELLWPSRHNNGHFTNDAVSLPNRLSSRWLISDYSAGDLLIFTMHTMHAAGDNRTRRIRVSADTRYQPASEPTDERWIGESPIGHGKEAKQGLIC